MLIRDFKDTDADVVSKLISVCLTEVNTKDYPLEEIEEVRRSYTSDNLKKLSRAKQIYVAIDESKVVGTASLHHDIVSTVFVDPDRAGQGIGRQLMELIEKKAKNAGISELKLISSKTGHGFYLRLGYTDVEPRGINILMRKELRD